MEENRINEIICLQKPEIELLMKQFDESLEILDFSQMGESMSNTGYKVITNAGVYLLKLYSSGRDGIECSMYRKLQERILVPRLYFYDNSFKVYNAPYAVFEFVKGITLAEYIRQNHCFPENLAYEIGSMCAYIHKYSFASNGFLNEKLEIGEKLPGFREKLNFMLTHKPATCLKPETVESLLDFMKSDSTFFSKIDEGCVLSHGDFNCWNIMIVDEKAYCIDFEYACSDSRYRDIGNFFRRKDESIESVMSENVFQAFTDGYNAASDKRLPQDWLRIARICNIVTMLGLFLNDHFPVEWIPDIEKDILMAIQK